MILSLVSKKSSYHKEYTLKYESSISYHSKGMANVNFFETDRKKDRQAGQLLYATGLSILGA